tara:strand:- start:60 stop:407 length:348 start_codon:yes stop_codon:yes gene_type:complete
MRFKVILAMVNEDHQEKVIQAAKEAGATGVTILNARGEGIRGQKSFFGLNVEVQKEVLLFLVEDFISDDIMDAIFKAGQFKERGNGIAFSLLVERGIGLESQMTILEEDAKKHYF